MFLYKQTKNPEKIHCQQNPTKVVSSSDSRKMILSNKIKMQERIKDNWLRYIKYINLNEYYL